MYTKEEIDYLEAMEEYKRRSGRMFPTWREVLEVVEFLGYSKPKDRSASRPDASNEDQSGPYSPIVGPDIPWSAYRDLALMTSLPFSVVGRWKRGEQVEVFQAQLLNEMARLWLDFAQVVRPERLHEWLRTPNDFFGGLMPVQILHRGESDRLRALIYELEAGLPL